MGMKRNHSIQMPKLLLLFSAVLLFCGAFPFASSTLPQATHSGPNSSTVSSSAAKADYVVIKAVAKMYSKPTVDSDVVSQAIYGTDVAKVKAKHGWVNVRTADDYTGWMQSSALRKLKGQPYAAGGVVVRVAQLSANIYREPDVTKHAPLITIPWESRLEVMPGKAEDGERWLKVRLPDGSDGFVQAGDVSSDFAALTIEQTVFLAKKFIGVTYAWGGSSDFGFDCSGFMQMLMRQRGIIMPRDANLQAAWKGMSAVERKDLQPGDLLYFGDRPDHITHTGMFLGNGEFIHDTTHNHPGVQISVLDEQPWTKLFVAARRAK